MSLSLPKPAASRRTALAVVDRRRRLAPALTCVWLLCACAERSELSAAATEAERPDATAGVDAASVPVPKRRPIANVPGRDRPGGPSSMGGPDAARPRDPDPLDDAGTDLSEADGGSGDPGEECAGALGRECLCDVLCRRVAELACPFDPPIGECRTNCLPGLADCPDVSLALLRCRTRLPDDAYSCDSEFEAHAIEGCDAEVAASSDCQSR